MILNMAMVHIQESNHVSTHFLLRNYCNGNAFKDAIKKVSRKLVTGGKRSLRKKLEKMDKKEEEERSPLILVLPKLAGKKS